MSSIPTLALFGLSTAVFRVRHDHMLDTLPIIDSYGYPSSWLTLQTQSGTPDRVFIVTTTLVYNILFYASIVYTPVLFHRKNLELLVSLLGVSGGIGLLVTGGVGFALAVTSSVTFSGFGFLAALLAVLGGILSWSYRKAGSILLVSGAVSAAFTLFFASQPSRQLLLSNISGSTALLSPILLTLAGGLLGTYPFLRKAKKV